MSCLGSKPTTVQKINEEGAHLRKVPRHALQGFRVRLFDVANADAADGGVRAKLERLYSLFKEFECVLVETHDFFPGKSFLRTGATPRAKRCPSALTHSKTKPIVCGACLFIQRFM